MSSELRRRVESGGLFQGYAYSYPHKTAYRHLTPALPLEEVWRGEDKEALFLYAHVPFCGMRCGFCNLFTVTSSSVSVEERYLDALDRQTDAALSYLRDARFARGAIGGGTPTMLSLNGLERLFVILRKFCQAPAMPQSVEMSPETVSPEKLAFLRDQGTTRASMGVQSLIPAETKALGRPQDRAVVERSLGLIREAGFPVMNVDLIYGIPGQDAGSWEESLRGVMNYCPEEVYLYPLYVRPLTGLGRKGRAASIEQARLYRQGRDFLLSRGYEQVSMRLFRMTRLHQDSSGPVYCCQEDGMAGFGAGARSYTRRVHYSTEWAVGRTTVSAILEDFIGRDEARFSQAEYGCILDAEEERRRFVIKSLLRADGLSEAAYAERFGNAPLADFPQLQELLAEGAAVRSDGILRPTALGLEWSDVIGPWMYSPAAQEKMEAFPLQ